jgi:hypothetical protein
VRSLTAGIASGRGVDPQRMANYARALGVDPDTPLSAAQEARARQIIGNNLWVAGPAGEAPPVQGAAAGAPPSPNLTFDDRVSPVPAQTSQADPAAALVPRGYQGDSRNFAQALRQRAEELRRQANAGGVVGIPSKAKEDEAASLDRRADQIDEAWKKYSEPGANADLQSRIAAAKKAGDALGERHAEVIKAGGAPARGTIDTLDVMESALRRSGGDLTTGPYHEAGLHFRQAVNNIIPGFFDQNKISDAETVVKLNAQLAAQAAKAMTARPSQLEFRAFMANNPGLATTPQGTLFLIEVLRREQRQAIELSREAARSRPEDWPEREDAYYRAHPLFSEAEKRDVRYVTAPTVPVFETREQTIEWARAHGIKAGEPVKTSSGRIVAAP